MAITLQLLYIVLWAVYIVSVVGSIIVMLSENRNPIRSLAWVIALIFLPVVGVIFYLFLGRSPKVQHMMNRRSKRRIASAVKTERVDLDALSLPPQQKLLVKLASSLSFSPLTVHNTLDIYSEGSAKFDALKEDLRRAESSIYLQYYIFSDDETGREIASILKEKARAGVSVKVIYDHVGSFSAHNRFFRDMRRAGVDVHPFFRVTFPQLANRINWRNHRKIVVIDGRVGYIGGMNIASRYLRGQEGRVWRDTHFRVTGEIVKSLLASFALDWSFMNQSLENLPPLPEVTVPSTVLGMQLVTSGPTDPWHSLSLCFLKAISSARKCVYIQTPYFLPTEALLEALQTAALAQVDVRVMIPRVSDSKVIRYASFSYVTQLLNAGIKVYLYEPGMLHSKNMIIDDDLVTSGSTNFDFRSFENNFESNLFIYSRRANESMRSIFFADMKECRKVTLSEWHHRPLFQRFMESTVRLLAPIL